VVPHPHHVADVPVYLGVAHLIRSRWRQSPKLVQLLGYTKEQIEDLCVGIETDPSFQRLKDLRAQIKQ